MEVFFCGKDERPPVIPPVLRFKEMKNGRPPKFGGLPSLVREFDQYSPGWSQYLSSRTRRITGGKITTLNWATQFLTKAYHGACCPNISVRIV